MKTVTQKRNVCGFDRVRMQDWGELYVAQGAERSLTIKTAEQTLQKIFSEVVDGQLILCLGRDRWERLQMGLHTGLARPSIRYTLQVRDLTGLAVFGFGRATVAALNTPALALALSGAGTVSVHSLSAGSLRASLSGGGSITVTGRAGQESVSLSGTGQYDAGQLQSQVARVSISGAGHAKVWVMDDLQVHLAGLGSAEYYGHPAVRRRTSGLGSLRPLGSAPAVNVS
jgi:hypothetical protein